MKWDYSDESMFMNRNGSLFLKGELFTGPENKSENTSGVDEGFWICVHTFSSFLLLFKGKSTSTICSTIIHQSSLTQDLSSLLFEYSVNDIRAK